MRSGSLRRWFPVGCAAALLLLGCEDGLPTPDLAAHEAGAALVVPDLAQPALRGVACGEGRCYNEANQYCHTDDWGDTGACEMRASPGPGYFACDGPEDCPTRACCLLGEASVCGAFGFCVAGTTVGEYMCHVDAECGALSRCCPKSPGHTYRVCVGAPSAQDPCPG